MATPLGPARVTELPATPASPDTTLILVLGHGAGGGLGSPDLQALGRALPQLGVRVVLVEQPWRVAGRRVAAPAAQLDQAWSTVVRGLAPAGRLVVGGRSAGARVACRTARSLGAVGALALAFPLVPPWRPDRSRAAELLGARVPTLVVQGTRDEFGAPAAFPPGDYEMVPINGADHAFAVPRGSTSGRPEAEDALRQVTLEVGAWLSRLAGESVGGS